MRSRKTTTLGWEVRSVSVVIGIILMAWLTGCTAPPPGGGAVIDAVYVHAEGIHDGELAQRKAYDLAVFEWAAESGLAGVPSYSELEQDYTDAVSSQVAGKATGTGVYGARTMTLWDFYLEQVERRVQLLKPEIREALSMDEVREYYEQHPEAFKRQELITLKVTDWQGGRALSTREVVIDETNVRMLQERDDALISAALDLGQGELATVQRPDGSFAQLECLSRKDNGVQPLDAVVQAAASQLADQRFGSEVQRRISAAS
ncbi:hypothetical protein [Arthrobacter psychrochitiniphilus]|uniref:hypothetical protein n=1 Tax=Arthrobacter psychrochitiniphilus TaxID=291045 RepID=UPI003F7CD312